MAATSATHPAVLSVVYWSDPAHSDRLRVTTQDAALKAINLKYDAFNMEEEIFSKNIF